MTRRRQLLARGAAGVALALLLLLGFGLGRASSSSSSPTAEMGASNDPAPSTVTPSTEPDGSWTCPTVTDHSEEGAATTAMAGLYSAALVKLAPATTPARADQITQLLDRFVVSEKRQEMRSYLETPSTLTGLAETPVAYSVVSYQPDVAVVRLLLVDFAHRADGTPTATAGVKDTTLHWDPTAAMWRLAAWPPNPDPEALAGLSDAGHFCHLATAG